MTVLEDSDRTLRTAVCARCDTARVDSLVPLSSCSRPPTLRSGLKCRQGTAVGHEVGGAREEGDFVPDGAPVALRRHPAGRNKPSRVRAAGPRYDGKLQTQRPVLQVRVIEQARRRVRRSQLRRAVCAVRTWQTLLRPGELEIWGSSHARLNRAHAALRVSSAQCT